MMPWSGDHRVQGIRPRPRVLTHFLLFFAKNLFGFAALVLGVVLRVSIALDTGEFHQLVRMAIAIRGAPVTSYVPASRPWLRIDGRVGHRGFIHDRIRVRPRR